RLVNVLLGAQTRRVAEANHRPELAEPVLDRRAGESESRGGAEAARCAALGSAGVLDLLCLVEDDATPGQPGQCLSIAGDERVRREDEVDVPDRRRERVGVEP